MDAAPDSFPARMFAHRRAYMKIVAALLLLSAVSVAQQITAPRVTAAPVYDAPHIEEPQPFLDGWNDALILSDVLAKVGDARFSIRAHGLILCQPNGCYQPYATHGIDPILQPVSNHPAQVYLVQAGLLGTGMALAYEFHEHGHHRIARAVLAIGAIYSGGMAIYSWQNYRMGRTRGITANQR